MIAIVLKLVASGAVESGSYDFGNIDIYNLMINNQVGDRATGTACVYAPVTFSRPFCELANEYALDRQPPLPLAQCDATLTDVCPVTTDECPASRTAATFLLFFGFGLAITPMAYLLSFLFEHHMAAQIYIILITFITGIILCLTLLDSSPQNLLILGAEKYLVYSFKQFSI
jgi:hypothetical protein